MLHPSRSGVYSFPKSNYLELHVLLTRLDEETLKSGSPQTTISLWSSAITGTASLLLHDIVQSILSKIVQEQLLMYTWLKPRRYIYFHYIVINKFMKTFKFKCGQINCIHNFAGRWLFLCLVNSVRSAKLYTRLLIELTNKTKLLYL